MSHDSGKAVIVLLTVFLVSLFATNVVGIPLPNWLEWLLAVFSWLWWLGTRDDADEAWQAISRGGLALALAFYAADVYRWAWWDEHLHAPGPTWISSLAGIITFLVAGRWFQTSAEKQRNN